jgi:hypothetical protein
MPVNTDAGIRTRTKARLEHPINSVKRTAGPRALLPRRELISTLLLSFPSLALAEAQSESRTLKPFVDKQNGFLLYVPSSWRLTPRGPVFFPSTCAVLFYAVLCCSTLFYAGYVMLFGVVLCSAVLCDAVNICIL